MNIYIITQDEEQGYDTFDSAVVIAENEQEAKKTHPCSLVSYPESNDWKNGYGWCSSPEMVQATLIGTAVEGQVKGVVLASFNAG